MKHDICQHTSKGLFALTVLAVCLLFTSTTHADRFESDNWVIDASAIGNTFGGTAESDNYRMTTAGGESIIGNGLGGSYKLGQGYVAQLEQAMQISIQPSGLASYYPMDEDTGTRVHDDSPNENSSTGQTSASWIAGKIGSALSFGGDDSVTIPHNHSLNFTSAMTLTAWVQPGASSQGEAAIISKDTSGTNYWLGLADGSNEAEFRVDCPGSTSVISTTTINNTGNWYHIVGVKDGNDLKIFINGQLENTASCGADANTNSGQLLLGNDDSNNYFNGTIDEAKLLNRAFFDKEVENEYTATNAGTPSTLTFPSITPGTSEVMSADVVVQTDAPGYLLGIVQDGDLTNGSSTIPGVSGSISSPSAWSEGTTTGLGFTLSGGNVSIPGSWGTDPSFNYAALPDSVTTFYTKAGLTGGTKDILEMQYRIDVEPSVPAGDYSNTTTYIGTLLP